MQTVGKAKGTHVVQVQVWLRRNVAPTELARLESDERHEWLKGLLVNLWYDMDGVLALLEEGARLTGKSLREVTREVATRNALHDLRGVHRVFLKYSATNWSLGLLPSLWRAYFDFGKPRIVVNARGHFQIDTTIPERYVEWVSGGWEGFLRQMAILTGATSPRLDVQLLPATHATHATGERVVRANLRYGPHIQDDMVTR
jgi:hypothetical protein